MQPGDAIYIYTDGLVDAPGALDDDKLRAIAVNAPSIEAAVATMVEQALAGTDELPDDLTIIAIECVA